MSYSAFEHEFRAPERGSTNEMTFWRLQPSNVWSALFTECLKLRRQYLDGCSQFPGPMAKTESATTRTSSISSFGRTDFCSDLFIDMKSMFCILTFLLTIHGSASAFAAPSSESEKPSLIVVSDIDDTIRLTMVHHEGSFLHYFMGLFQQKAFIGMPALYSFLAAKGARIEYVSGTPTFLRRIFPAKFLELAGFPVGQLYTRDDYFEPIEDYKYRTILKLMRENPAAEFLFLGDNGQRDIVTYARLMANPEVSDRIRDVYVRKPYGEPDALELAEGQIPFYTAADLSVSLHMKGYLEVPETQVIVRSMDNGLRHSESSVRERALPPFTPISINAVIYLKRLLDGITDSVTKALFARVISQSVQQNGTPLARVGNDSCQGAYTH